jgi:hypothetical protein
MDIQGNSQRAESQRADSQGMDSQGMDRQEKNIQREHSHRAYIRGQRRNQSWARPVSTQSTRGQRACGHAGVSQCRITDSQERGVSHWRGRPV